MVPCCDTLHNVRAIAADVMAGHDVFSRFKAGREGTLWYYRELLGTFAARFGVEHPLVVELGRSIDVMSRWTAFEIAAVPLRRFTNKNAAIKLDVRKEFPLHPTSWTTFSVHELSAKV